MSDTLRHLHLVGAAGQAKVVQYDGREHLVVPVIALMEGVIHAVNAETAEFVPAAALSVSPQLWNGRPLVLGHPTQNGTQVSANTTHVLESQSFGQIFNARMSGTRLLMDAYVDPAKAERIGGKDMVKRLRAGETLEVSVGAFVNTIDESGTHNGKAYKARWSTVAPDHLAFLPNGRGACSVEMGCGTHRAAEAYTVTEEGFEALGGPGSGWTAENGHVAGSQGGGAHEAAAKAHETAALAHTAASASAGGSPSQLDAHAQMAAKATAAALKATKSTGTDPYAAKAAKAYSKMSSDKPLNTAAMHESAAQMHQSAAAWHRTVGTLHSSDRPRGKPTGTSVKDGVTYHGSALGHLPKLSGRKLEMKQRSLRERLLSLFSTKTDAELKALLDTPEEAASEEAAELIGYHSLAALIEHAQVMLDSAKQTVEDLISDEEENPTETAAQEDAEEEVETARLDAIQSNLYSASTVIQNALSTAYRLNLPDLPEPSDPRYMEAFRAAIGKTISAKNMQTIQAAHDASHQMHNQTTALGASCCSSSAKLLEEKDDTLRAAESAPKETVDMAKIDIVKALTSCPCSGYTQDHEKTLLGLDDSILAVLTANTEKLKTALAAAEKPKEPEAPKALSEAEFLASHPELNAIVTRQRAADTLIKTELVTKLKAANAFTEEELNAKPVEELQKLATLAHVEAPVADYSGRGVVVAAQVADEMKAFEAPDPYAAGLKAMQERTH